jgi:hypothetical protein
MYAEVTLYRLILVEESYRMRSWIFFVIKLCSYLNLLFHRSLSLSLSTGGSPVLMS